MIITLDPILQAIIISFSILPVCTIVASTVICTMNFIYYITRK